MEFSCGVSDDHRCSQRRSYFQGVHFFLRRSDAMSHGKIRTTRKYKKNKDALLQEKQSFCIHFHRILELFEEVKKVETRALKFYEN